MSDEAVIRATFCKILPVDGRGQSKLIFEIPAEHTEEVIRKFGWPLPSNPKWCAIALLNEQ